MAFSIPSNAKINLYLRVIGKRPDGFHELETVMAPIDLADEMTFEDSGEITLNCDDPSLPTDSRNLVVRAALLLKERFQIRQGARIGLKKKIPVGAGLGGGSSNATHALKGLNRLWSLRLSAEELERLAAELGSDTAFFVRNRPAFARGRGEKLEAMVLEEDIPVLLLNFGFGSSTAWAYRHCAPGPQGAALDPGRDRLNRRTIPPRLRNDLQPPVFGKFPILPQALEEIRGRPGVLGAMMSGSGSTLFAVLERESAAAPLAAFLKGRFGEQIWLWAGRILSGEGA